MTTVVLPVKAEIRPTEFSSTTWYLDLERVPTPIRFADLLDPGFWVHHATASRIRRGDLIRVLGQSQSFDVLLVVVAAYPGGLSVEPWPRLPTRGTEGTAP